MSENFSLNPFESFKDSSRSDENYFRFIVLFLLFLLLAFDQTLALIYIAIMVADFIWYAYDRSIQFPIRRTSTKFGRVIVEVLIAYAAFLAIATFITKTIPQTQSLFQLLSTATPALKGSKILTLLGWGIAVPFIETSFFNGRLFEGIRDFVARRMNRVISLSKIDVGAIITILIVSAFFALFHITAKSLSSTALFITFIFSIISCLLIMRQQELRGAIMLHVLSNSVVVLSTLGWLPFLNV